MAAILIFFATLAITLCIYYAVKKQYRYIVLLLASLAFFAIVSPLRSLASYSTFYIQKKCIGLDAVYYKGEGTHLPWGDPLYRCGNYARIDGILYALNTPNVEASFRWCMHYVDGVWDNSQQIYIRARLHGKLER